MGCALSVFLTLSGCGQGSQSNNAAVQEPAGVVVENDQALAAAPHRFDIYRATNANRAIIFLHGGGGNKHHAAYQFGINTSDVDGDYGSVNKEVLLGNRALAVFPQGQALPAAPGSFTWTNYVTKSGQDDMAFIRELVSFISARYRISRFYIVGHSTGGMLANRIWCEQPDLFDGYVSIAGPPAQRFLDPLTSCSPGEVKPYLGIVRSNDRVLGVSGNWDARTWTINRALMLPDPEAFDDPVVIGERYFLQTRVAKRCGREVPDGDASGTSDGSITTWSFCDDSIRLLKVDSDQSLDALQKAVWGFLSPSEN